MGIWNSTLVYVGARTLLAGAMIALLLRRRVGAIYAGGQVVSDLSCAAFLLAYVNPDIRDDIGWLVVPLILFVLYWEATRFLDNRIATVELETAPSWLSPLASRRLPQPMTFLCPREIAPVQGLVLAIFLAQRQRNHRLRHLIAQIERVRSIDIVRRLM